MWRGPCFAAQFLWHHGFKSDLANGVGGFSTANKDQQNQVQDYVQWLSDMLGPTKMFMIAEGETPVDRREKENGIGTFLLCQVSDDTSTVRPTPHRTESSRVAGLVSGSSQSDTSSESESESDTSESNVGWKDSGRMLTPFSDGCGEAGG